MLGASVPNLCLEASVRKTVVNHSYVLVSQKFEAWATFDELFAHEALQLQLACMEPGRESTWGRVESQFLPITGSQLNTCHDSSTRHQSRPAHSHSTRNDVVGTPHEFCMGNTSNLYVQQPPSHAHWE